ncbi:ATP-binding protein [Desulfosporosinus sp. BG]|uniref:ATP-binding protein n=1 Tax=Desulfosporosinus sp. BG TaxID=1633135 RepID=UPI00083A2C74|nr:ATP-binding protein [Desulfosporosinus sp. BG]ODA40247.1 Sporulation kinase [Desulfosporosinus sp. BG]
MTIFSTQYENKSYKKEIDELLISDNFNRTGKLATVLFVINIMMLFIDYIDKTKGLWIIDRGYKDLFYSHVVLGLVTLLYIISFYGFGRNTHRKITLLHKYYGVLFAYFILCLSAVTSGWIDQQIHGQITVYIIGCLSIAVIYNYEPKITALIYGLSGLVVMSLLTFIHHAPNIQQANYLNAFLIGIISYFLSVELYKLKRQDMLNKYLLEDLVKERTIELQNEILERQRAETEVVRLDRLRLIGEMAASISHEVRNPMTTVKGFLQLIKHKQDSRDKEYFALMIEELDRANSILSEFLSISRAKATVLEWLNLNEIITSTLPLIQADAQNSDKLITVELNKVPDLPLDLQEIRQLLLNLARNGLEAMSSGGRLTIRTSSTDHDVTLIISDGGKGIEQSLLEKLGTPFFTTKEHGTGLGLAVCYGIASRHNGKISVETCPQGSTFYVQFKLVNRKG